MVKTTPKPKATKKSKGELGPFPPPLPALAVGVGLDVADGITDVEEAILDERCDQRAISVDSTAA